MYLCGQRRSPEMENGFAPAWNLGLHRDIDHFQNPVFGDAFWGNPTSLFGIITYVSASALVTSSKTPHAQIPKNFVFGKPFSQFGKGEPRLPLCFLIWEKESEATSAVCCWGISWATPEGKHRGLLFGLPLRSVAEGKLGDYLCGLPLWEPLGLPLQSPSWDTHFGYLCGPEWTRLATFLPLGNFEAKNFRNI